MDKTIGLAMRARKISIGTDMTLDQVRKGQVYLIVLAKDASSNTKKKVTDKAKTYQVDVIESMTSLALSNAIGKKDIKVIGIMDKGFKHLLMSEKGSDVHAE
jgi:ribosomal protein L7Ae-like RNA K-turn-binding protein